MTKSLRRRVLLALSAAAVTSAGGCVQGGPTPGQVDVVAAFYPLAFLVERIGGPQVAVHDLTPPGAEPHEIELSPRQVAAIRDSDLLLYLRHLSPAIDDAADEAPARWDAAQAGSVRGGDVHVWLDPQRMRQLAAALQRSLEQQDPEHASEYVERTASLDRELAALDAEFRRGLSDCQRNAVVTTHEAFGYLTDRYGLTQVAVSGLSPEAEPAPGRLAEVTSYVRRHGVRTIYFESLLSPKVARLLAASTGATTAVLDPIETAPARGDYMSAMRANLAALRKGLGCR